MYVTVSKPLRRHRGQAWDETEKLGVEEGDGVEQGRKARWAGEEGTSYRMPQPVKMFEASCRRESPHHPLLSAVCTGSRQAKGCGPHARGGKARITLFCRPSARVQGKPRGCGPHARVSVASPSPARGLSRLSSTIRKAVPLRASKSTLSSSSPETSCFVDSRLQ